MTIWHKFKELGWQDRGLLLEAVVLMATARIVILVIPFKRIAQAIGEPMHQAAADIPATKIEVAAQVGWAVETMATWVPWKSTCLVQALAGTRMLQRRKVPTTLFFGMGKEEGKVIAHAWVKTGEEIVIGKAGHEQYVVVSTFA